MNITTFLQKKKPQFLSIIIQKIIFPNCTTLLDVGCGNNSVVQFFKKKLNKTTGIDIYELSIKKSKQKNIHQKYVVGDILNINKYFKNKSFDCVLNIDVLEHLEKEEAINLIKRMENISKKIVILQTPNGFVKQNSIKGNKYQIHKCNFKKNELKKMGYTVIGMDGPKIFRGEQASIKYRPKLFFTIITNLLTPIFFFLPQYSFSLLAYKKIN